MDFRTKRNKLALGISTALLSVGLSSTVFASSHREAPQITRTPTVDATDFYAFMDYSGESGTEDKVILVANYYPLQDAYGGPNYFTMDPNAIYEIHIDNDGDAVEDITFQFKFSQSLATPEGFKLAIGDKMVDVPLKNASPVDSADALINFNESYTVTMIKGDRRTGQRIELNGGAAFPKPLDNIGEKSFGDYAAYADTFIHDFNITSCDKGASQVFVGQRKDPFVVNLGQTFDLVNYTPFEDGENGEYGSSFDGPNDLADKNVTTLALSIDKSCLLGNTDVIGAWTTASLQQGRILNPKATFAKPEVNGGAYTQVSRLGMPLVNEVVIGLSNKDKFNASEPKDDGQFADYVTNPTLPALLNILFGDKDAAPGEDGNIAPNNFPRTDLVTAFLTGFDGVNALESVTPSEMLRLNTNIEAFPTVGLDSHNPLGLVAGDLSGFPNGRRPTDDVVDIALRVVMGALCHPVDLNGDGTPEANLGVCELKVKDDGTTETASDIAPAGTAALTDRAPVTVTDRKMFRANFPFLATPIAGSVTAAAN